MRVLDRSVVSLSLDKVGMDNHSINEFRKIMTRPNGIVLVTGPTGSGKTTTLYSALSEMNEITEKVITTEDPVEYDIDGITCRFRSIEVVLLSQRVCERYCVKILM